MDPWYSEILKLDMLNHWAGGEVPTYIRIGLAFVLGTCIGSFLNVIAHRSLAHESWIKGRSYCPQCKTPIKFFDLIPVVSYAMLQGKCRECKKTISWHYPVVELFTGVIFAILIQMHGYTYDGLAMCFFTAILIAVCITDFKEKLIPHEITYPAILIGLAYFGIKHGGVGDALIGAGVSYILFDFIDFYGLIAITHLKDEEEEKTEVVLDEYIENIYPGVPRIVVEPEYDPDDDIVMGGGDAVLSAVIACWLGWQSMAVAVVVAFLAGSVMGAFFLVGDMAQRGVLQKALRPAAIGFAIGFLILSIPLVSIGLFVHAEGEYFTPQLFYLACFGGIAGALLGAVMSGSRFTNRFAFGPALAIGALAAMLMPSDAWYSPNSWGIMNGRSGISDFSVQSPRP